METVIRKRIRDCPLVIHAHGKDAELVKDSIDALIVAFDVEDFLFGLVPNIANTCEEVATAFENYLRENGLRNVKVTVDKPEVWR